MWWASSVAMAPQQVQKRKQEDPDDVDEMPVKAADLYRAVVLRRDDSTPCPGQHPQHDANADDHVERVQARHQEVQREEQLRVPRVFLLELKPWPRHVVLDELVVVLDAFDAEKRRAEQD